MRRAALWWMCALWALCASGCWTSQVSRARDARVVEQGGVSAQVEAVEHQGRDALTHVRLRLTNRAGYRLELDPARVTLALRDGPLPLMTSDALGQGTAALGTGVSMGSAGLCAGAGQLGGGLGSGPLALPALLVFGTSALLLTGVLVVGVGVVVIVVAVRDQASRVLEPGASSVIRLELARPVALSGVLAHPSDPVLQLRLGEALRRVDGGAHVMPAIDLIDRDAPHLGYGPPERDGVLGVRVFGGPFLGEDLGVPGFGGFEVFWGPRWGAWSWEASAGFLAPLGTDVRRRFELAHRWSLSAGLGYELHLLPLGAHGPRATAELAWTPAVRDWLGHTEPDQWWGLFVRGGPLFQGRWHQRGGALVGGLVFTY